MVILKRYRILIIIGIILAIVFWLYHIWLIDKALDYILDELLKNAEYNCYTFNVKNTKVSDINLTKSFCDDILYIGKEKIK